MTATHEQTESAQPPSKAPPSGYIIGPVCDSIFIIGAPILAVLVVIPLSIPSRSSFDYSLHGVTYDLRQVFIGAFIAAHLVLVFFRSHINAEVFRRHRFRFTVVPAALLIGTALSPWILGLVGVVTVWWDVYHSSLQTFGFCRIYDAKQRNNPAAGRRLDYWMNLFLYTGPILAGVHFMDHVRTSRSQLTFLMADRGDLSTLLLEKIPGYLEQNQTYLSMAVLAVGLPFLIYYLVSYYRLYREGYHVSWQKVSLLCATGSVSIYAWGFTRILDAFFVMNFFHALQYFAIVWFTEQKNMTRAFRLNRFSFGKGLALSWIVILCFLYGLWIEHHVTGTWGTGLGLTVAIMHFWYDGFIWSVSKKHV